MTNKETYLGDGLYASFDGWMITLRAPREHGDHFVGLEPAIWVALKRFAKECYAPASDDEIKDFRARGPHHYWDEE